ncbi:MAG: tetratricopeptide repeat protein, partial [Acidobacteriota bacterium]
MAVPSSAAAKSDQLLAGGRHIAGGRLNDAITDLDGAVKEFRRTSNAEGEAVSLLLLGIAETGRGHVGPARSHLQSALEILRERNDAIGTWLALSNLAQMERSIGNYGTALARQEEAQNVVAKAQATDLPLTLDTFDLMASALGLPTIDWSEAPTGADEYVQAILLETIVMPLTHDGFAGILIEVGQYERAEKELRAALAGPALFAGAYESSVAAHFGELRYRQRRFNEAREYYEKALLGSLRLPMNPLSDQWVKVAIYSRLADLEMAENHLEAALALNEQSLEGLRGAQIPLESRILEERGLLLLQGDRLTDADAAFQQALAIAMTNTDTIRRASVERHLADLGLLMGKYGTAITHLEEAIRLQQISDPQATEGLLWTSLAVCYILMSKDEAAGPLLAHALSLAETSQLEIAGDLTTFLETLQDLRKGTATKQDLRAALQHLSANRQFTSMDISGDVERALRQSLSLQDAATSGAPTESMPALGLFTGIAYSNLAWSRLADGNTTAARAFFEKALKENATGELRARYEAAIGACHWRDGNVEKAIQWFSAAAQTLDEIVDDLRAESMLVSFLGSREHRAYYDVLIEALLRDHHDEKAFEVTERARARGLLRGRNGRKTPSSGGGEGLARKVTEIRRQIEHWDATPVEGETLESLRFRYDLLLSRVQSTTPPGPSLNGP